MVYRLAFDLGGKSIGWCLLNLDEQNQPSGIMDMGVRVFSDGLDARTKRPLGEVRRTLRGARRRRDRYIRRRDCLLTYLVRVGLMPKSIDERKALEINNPYQLRALAVEYKISLYDLGRVLFHINQRRGFKSNRKLISTDEENGPTKKGIKALQNDLKLSGLKTLGEFLYQKFQNSERVLMRPEVKGNKYEYAYYPTREMYEYEVDTILKKQKEFHPELTEQICNNIKNIIFYQRPLKPQFVEYCLFESNEKRIRLASIHAQRFRILKELNNLEIVQIDNTYPMITYDDRKKLLEALNTKKELSFNSIRKILSLPEDVKFNYELIGNKKGIIGNTTNFYLSKKKFFGSLWYDFSLEKQERIVQLLISDDDNQRVLETLISEYSCSIDTAKQLLIIPIEREYSRLSKKAINRIYPVLEKGVKYQEACEAVGYNNAQRLDRNLYYKLPYYGIVLNNSVIGGTFANQDKVCPEKFYGKINNQNLHIVLNQMRKLTNAIIEQYGLPTEIVFTLSPELKYGGSKLSSYNFTLKKNQKRSEFINLELSKLNVPQNFNNRLKYQLWEDLNDDPNKRFCVFTGKKIEKKDIFSGDFVVSYLLPFHRSFSDRTANKIICCKSAHIIKGCKSPYESFGHKVEWPEILERANNLPLNKRWRFKENAWEIAQGRYENIILREIKDYSYISRIVEKYLSSLTLRRDGLFNVSSVSGRLKHLFRHKWNLNGILDDDIELQDPGNYRHRAIDAFVVGCATQSMVKTISSLNKNVFDQIIIPEPFDNHITSLKNKVEKIVISYKPDHGDARNAIKNGKTVAILHQRTAYGFVRKSSTKKGTDIYVTRKPLTSFNRRKDIEAVVDDAWRITLLDLVANIQDGSSEFRSVISEFSKKNKVYKMRVYVERISHQMVPIYEFREESHIVKKAYKFYSLRGNYCAELYEIKHGKKAGEWGVEIISNFYAHQNKFIPEWRKEYPSAKKIMTIYNNDMMAYEEEGKTIICNVKKMDRRGRLCLRDHRIANEKGTMLSWEAYVSGLQKKNARKISVDIMGRVKDPKYIRGNKI